MKRLEVFLGFYYINSKSYCSFCALGLCPCPQNLPIRASTFLNITYSNLSPTQSKCGVARSNPVGTQTVLLGGEMGLTMEDRPLYL